MRDSSDDTKDRPTRLLIHYIKSPLLRAVHADGIFGGVTPHGNIHISFWNERNPIPQLIEHEITPEGKLGREIIEARIGKTGLVREVDVEVIMDLGTAISFRKWLDDKIATLQAIVDKQKDKA